MPVGPECPKAGTAFQHKDNLLLKNEQITATAIWRIEMPSCNTAIALCVNVSDICAIVMCENFGRVGKAFYFPQHVCVLIILLRQCFSWLHVSVE